MKKYLASYIYAQEDEMMNDCYIVLQLRDSEELNVAGGVTLKAKFKHSVANYIKNGRAHILFKRCDISVVNELRKHITTIKNFTTYLLLTIDQAKDINTVEQVLDTPNFTNFVLIDKGDNFQVVAAGPE